MAADLGDLATFMQVARAGGFREAARLGSGSVSSISVAIRRLEARLGVRLFNRTTRKVVPTEAGARLLERLGPAFGEVEAALDVVNGFRDRPAGTLRLNVPVVAARLVLPRIVPAFLAAYPDIVLEVVAEDGFVDVLAAGCDAGIRYDERLEQDMIALPIGPREQRFATAASPAYLARHGCPEHPRDLLDHACLRARFSSGVLPPWEFEREGEVVRIKPTGPLVVRAGGAADLAVDAAVAGTGIIHLFENWLRPRLDDGTLVPVLQPWWQRFSGPFLYYPRRRYVPAPLRAFVDFIAAPGRRRSGLDGETPAGPDRGKPRPRGLSGGPMRGLMMDVPLLVSSILDHAASSHGDTEIVSRDSTGALARTTYSEIAHRGRKLARALDRLGLAPGDRAATLAWNGARHLEIYFGVSGSGRVCHTINPRLFPDQIAGIVAHAGDRVLFVDPGLVPLVEILADRLPALPPIVVMTDAAAMPSSAKLQGLLCYETLLADETDGYNWPALDENAAAGLCYTSGTTGAPKGALYSHRSTVLHAMAISVPDVFGFAAADTAMPVVPMFHVNAWGFPYASAMAGSKLVMPGPRLDGASLDALIRDEGVTATAGVPTVWAGLLDHVEPRGGSLHRLGRVGIGGSACPPALIERFARLGVDVIHAWGMTETSPVAVTSSPKNRQAGLAPGARRALAKKQGRPMFGIAARAVGPAGEDVPRDGVSVGTLLVRGPWVAARYFGSDGDEAFVNKGWFSTGDVVTIDPDGFVEIVDRTKDVIKSGGEWISSIELENIAVGHPAVQEAAVVGRPDARWGERPVLFVVLKAGQGFDRDALATLYADRVARWMVPTEFRIVDALPHTATGKLDKIGVRRLL